MFENLAFKACRKAKPTEARVLTQEDYELRGGLIETPEGVAPFEPQDMLARDAKGEYPIKRMTIIANYKHVGMTPDGWHLYLPLDRREAAQATERFTYGGLTGQPGDYVVRRLEPDGYHYWPVAKDIFEASYRFEETH
jgi:hypothetical protein